MSNPNDQGQPNGVPQSPPGMAIRMDCFTVTSASAMPPNPGLPPMAPPGSGFIPPSFVGGQQFTTSAPFPGFPFIPPPIPNFSPSFPTQGLPFTLGGLQGMGMPMGMGIPPSQFPILM